MNEKHINPFRPGAGHRPPYLAGRSQEKQEFRDILDQDVILRNLILTGLRGVGKTVLLEEYRDMALQGGWLWAGTDCSESASVTEDTIALRILTDIALVTSGIVVKTKTTQDIGFTGDSRKEHQYLDFQFLLTQYKSIPGLPIDKLKHLLLWIWNILKDVPNFRGIVFAYDEAQTLSDHAENSQYPLSVLLDLFQYLQRNNVRFLLVLTGLPTLLTRLIETRTYTERLFRVVVLNQLSKAESHEAILKPIENTPCAKNFTPKVINTIIAQSGGYPYFIQFICRELYDTFSQKDLVPTSPTTIPMDAIIQKLDNDFFAGRWSRATDRERELMIILARSGKTEFSLQDASLLSGQNPQFAPFSPSLISQFFTKLIAKGLIYKDRHGTYLFAVPLLAQYITRIHPSESEL